MNPSQRSILPQQQRARHYAAEADSYANFNRLTDPQLVDHVEALLPEHREQLFPPTETLSMFIAQALSRDSCCHQLVDDAMVKQVLGGLSVELNQQLGDGRVELGQIEEAVVAQARQDPALEQLRAHLCLGLVLGLIKACGQDGGGAPAGQLKVGLVGLGGVATGLAHGASPVIGRQQRRHPGEEAKHPLRRGDPVG